MCWSKRSQVDEDSKPKTTTRKPMSKIKCPEGTEVCVLSDNALCFGHGLCCFKGNEKTKFCVCHSPWEGAYCQDLNFYESRKDFQRTTAIAAFSAVLGVIVITLFIALVVLQIKYYRRRKKRRQMLASGDHDLNKISRPDASVKGSKKVLITQPGYSWRESVRRTGSKAAHKFRNTLSRSVPDDLFGVGVKLAIIGGFKPTDHQSTVGKAGVKAATPDRCFSAGDRQVICDQKDNANNEPIPVQIPATAAAAAAASGEAATEDTVM